VEVGTSFEQVRGEAVPQHVGIDTFLDPGAASGCGAGVVGSLGIGGMIAAVPAVAGK